MYIQYIDELKKALNEDPKGIQNVGSIPDIFTNEELLEELTPEEIEVYYDLAIAHVNKRDYPRLVSIQQEYKKLKAAAFSSDDYLDSCIKAEEYLIAEYSKRTVPVPKLPWWRFLCTKDKQWDMKEAREKIIQGNRRLKEIIKYAKRDIKDLREIQEKHKEL